MEPIKAEDRRRRSREGAGLSDAERRVPHPARNQGCLQPPRDCQTAPRSGNLAGLGAWLM